MDEHQSGVKLEEALEAKKELDAKAQKILEEKEADSRMRTYTCLLYTSPSPRD